jgi:hypothetical protein
VFFFKSFDFIGFELAQYALLPFAIPSTIFYIYFIIRIQNRAQVIKIFHIFEGKFNMLH